MPHRVAFLGFSEFERKVLASHFRLAHERSPAYTPVPTLTDADFLVVDAAHAPSVQLVRAIERLGETVFVGDEAPQGSSAWSPRPIDAAQVLHRLDSLVESADTLAPTDPLTLRNLELHLPPPEASPLSSPLEEGQWAAHEPRLAPTRAPEPEAEAEWQPPGSPRPATPTPPAKRPKPAKTPRVALLPATPRVLLVDDSTIALRFLELRLGAWHLEIDRAATSQAATDLLARHSYDIVFLDIELGAGSELDGLTLCQRIKQTPALLGALVVLVSAHHSELDRVRGALAGCDAHLAKPLDMQELQRLMERQGVRAVRDLSDLNDLSDASNASHENPAAP